MSERTWIVIDPENNIQGHVADSAAEVVKEIRGDSSLKDGVYEIAQIKKRVRIRTSEDNIDEIIRRAPEPDEE